MTATFTPVRTPGSQSAPATLGADRFGYARRVLLTTMDLTLKYSGIPARWVVRRPELSAALATAVAVTTPVTFRHVTAVVVGYGFVSGYGHIRGATHPAGELSLPDVAEFRKRNRALRRRWVTVMTDTGLVKAPVNGGQTKRMPKIRKVVPTPLGLAVLVDGSPVSAGPADFREKADKLRHGFRCRDIKITTAGPNTIRLDLRWGDPFRQPISFASLPAAVGALHVTVGLDEDGLPVAKDLRLPNLIVGAKGSGKALALDTPIPTPAGWTTMGELRAGDQVFDEGGRACTVTKAYPVLHGRPCYEVVFSDGTVIVADGEHQWITETHAKRNQDQRGGQRGRPRYSDDQLAHVRSRCAEPDRLISIPEVAAGVGLGPTSGIFHRVARQVGAAQSRKYRSQAFYKALHDAMAAPSNSHRVADHSGTVTTAEIAATVRDGRGVANHSIPTAGPLDYPGSALPVSPYVLGAWLGDGDSQGTRFTTADVEMVEHLEAEGVAVEHHGGYRYMLTLPPITGARSQRCGCGNWALPESTRCGACETRNSTTCANCGASCRGVRCRSCQHPTSTLTGVLRALGVLPKKHIPQAYMQGTIAQRRDLLAGLLDTDGTCDKTGGVEFCATNERLARQVLELAVSLGHKATLRDKVARLNGRDCGTAWTVAFTPHEPVFRLTRKLARQTLSPWSPTSTARRRYITDVRPIASVPVRCIEVDSPNHLYLASRSCIATHNSTEIWTLLAALTKAGIPFRLRVFDPKGGQEFTELEDAAWHYERNPGRWPQFLEGAHRALAARQADLRRQKIRDLTRFTDEYPLDVMVIDELLSALAFGAGSQKVKVDGKSIKADDAFMVYLATCRSAGHTVAALSQLGQKDVIGPVRGQFDYATCLRVGQTEKELVDIMLGSGASKAYPAHELSPARADAGIGYMRTETGVVKYRAARLSNDERRRLVESIRQQTLRLRAARGVETTEDDE